jgi:hypothetical protein
MFNHPEPLKKEETSKEDLGFFSGFTNTVKNINDSKIFAGIMILLLNVSSKFVNIRLSKTVESYLKNSFSRQFLVFIIAWMGTREFWVALVISFVFTFFVDYLLNEESMFCILPESFTDYHVELLKDDFSCKHFTEDDVRKAMDILTRAKAILDASNLSKTRDLENGTIDIQPNGSKSSSKPFLNQSWTM